MWRPYVQTLHRPGLLMSDTTRGSSTAGLSGPKKQRHAFSSMLHVRLQHPFQSCFTQDHNFRKTTYFSCQNTAIPQRPLISTLTRLCRRYASWVGFSLSMEAPQNYRATSNMACSSNTHSGRDLERILTGPPIFATKGIIHKIPRTEALGGFIDCLFLSGIELRRYSVILSIDRIESEVV